MKKIILLCLLFISVLTTYAQPIPPESIEDSVIGWMKIHHFKGTKEPLKVDDKYYSVAQLSISDSLANWMQASYMPKGGLGEIKKFVSPKLGLYDQHNAGKPQSYGAYSKTYVELKYNSSHKIEPFTNSNVLWNAGANQIPGNWSVRDICTPTQYYFTMPTAETEEDDEHVKKLLDLTKNPSTQRYITFWVKNMGFGRGWENVLLCKDNKSPFVKITKGEYLQALEAAIPRYYEAEKKKIAEANQGVQKRIEVDIKYLDAKIERLTSGLKKNKEKYKNRLSELALTEAQPGLMDLDTDRDIFSNGYLTDTESTSGRYPVYKVDPVVAELCKKDKPQWILVSWEYYPGDRHEQQQHEAIINNFNFDYVYNFFFAPEKVKGQPYKPLRSPVFKEAVVVTTASAASKKNAADSNIHFFDDFSTNAIGKTPLGWRGQVSANGASVTKLDGAEEKWVTVAQDEIKPTALKKPLPQNFTLSYDVNASQNFTWGAHGLTLTLAKETSQGNAESYLKLKLRPGYDGKDGEATFETRFPSPPGYSNSTKYVDAKGFSNNKKINRISVSIKKIGETVQVFIDNTKIIELEKAIPATHLFNALSFDGGAREGATFYISNVKITKD